jgi:hypothetical protein
MLWAGTKKRRFSRTKKRMMMISNQGKQQMDRDFARVCALVLGFSTITLTAQAVDKNPEDECMRLHPEITSPVEMVTCTSDLKGSQDVLEISYNALVKQVSADKLPQFREG